MDSLKQAEQKLETMVEKAEKVEKNILQNKWVQVAGAIAAVLIVCGSLLFWQMSSTRVSIDKSLISAPLICPSIELMRERVLSPA